MAGAQTEYISEKLIDELKSQVDDFKERSLQERRKKESVWRLVRKFFEGDQWQRVSKESLQLEAVPVPPKRPKITINKIMPGVMTRIAHVLKNKPIGVVTPETNDEEDRNAARIGDQVVEFDFRQQETERKLSTQIAPEMFLTNNAFVKAYWDPTLGKTVDVKSPIINPETQEPLTDPATGEPVTEVIGQTNEGGPVAEFVASEEFLPEPGAKTLDECQMVVHRTLKPLDYVRRMFPEKAKDLPSLDPESDYGKDLAAGAKHYGYGDAEIKNRAEVVEVWARPMTVDPERDDVLQWPEGLHAVFANGVCLLAEPTPKGHDHIPFVHFQETPVPWDFWGVSTAMQAIDPQRALNMAVSRDEYRRTMQRPKLWVPSQAGVDDEDVDNDDKSIVTYEHPFAGEWKAPPAFISDERARDFYVASIDDALGNVAILAGEADGEVRSGRQAFIQGEYAGTVLSGPARSIERGICRLGRLFLKLRKAWTDEATTIQLVGRDRDIEVLHFKGSDLEGAGDYYVEPGSALPMSRHEKKQMILDLWDRGILGPERKERLLRMIDMPAEFDALVNEDQIDRDRATEENEMLEKLDEETVTKANMEARGRAAEMAQAMTAKGLQVQPEALVLDATLEVLTLDARDFENHLVHLEVHNRFRKSRRYRALPKAIQALADQHADKHEAFGAMALGAIGGALGGMPGAPGDAGGGMTTPTALMPGGMPLGASAAAAGGQEPAGDIAGGMPAMPQTPSPGNGK
jgi:hypothetical protein